MTSEQLSWKIRRHGIEMTHLSGGSHIASVMSVADIMAVLYTDVLNIEPCNPEWDERDRLILSKGHAGAAVYAALAEKGFFPIDELKTHYQNGSRLSGHVSHYLPGVDFSTGSLGHGLSVGAGMAYAAKKDYKSHQIYVVLGDGECDEGSVWEAAMFANHYQLNNLIVTIDHNQMQSLDYCEKTIKLEPFSDKWRAFGWNVLVINGNSHSELLDAFTKSKSERERPTVIIANTVKGKGVSFMEKNILWHYRFPHDGWEYECAVEELHENMPSGVEDPYTPDGFRQSVAPEDSESAEKYMLSATWKSNYPKMNMLR